ncbi:uncharacterized protein LOC125231427 [Leguminivora glycinivorella]|uniref:uncharacterized protein LOC125231427 n=1 Tax=Leguminivora glycinivorella TaxID=1035111 RepID=UPI00200F7C76|nr:uncharacterized protein LOC125231427 [Leguminivora glycinivorella]
MWKYMVLYLYMAAGLVAGEWHPQDYGQSQASVPSDQRSALPPVFTEQLANMPRARPCRRRNFGDPTAPTDSGWMPLPYGRPPMAQQFQQTGNQPFRPQLKPQSLTESPAVDNKNLEADQVDRKSEYPDKVVEFVEKSSVLNQMSSNDKNKISNNDFLDTAGDHDPRPAIVDKRGYQDPDPVPDSIDHLDSHEHDTLECGENGDVVADSRSGNPEMQDGISKSSKSSIEMRDQAAKLLDDCIHASRRSMPDYELDSRRVSPDSLSSVEDKTGTDITLRTVPLRNTKTNVLKPILTPNTIITPPKNVIDKKYYLQNPAKNAGKWSDERQMSLIENGKTCYACSTHHDPSCWKTNATTTIKYCNRDNNACLTKMYKIDGKSILIRDCGHTCNEDEGYNIGQKMVSCSMCHSDMCNSAYGVHSLNVLLVGFLVAAIKFTLQ